MLTRLAAFVQLKIQFDYVPFIPWDIDMDLQSTQFNKISLSFTFLDKYYVGWEGIIEQSVQEYLVINLRKLIQSNIFFLIFH